MKVILAVLGIVFMASNAYASDFFQVPTISITMLGGMITGILMALGLLWGARKAVKAINRS